MAAKKKTLTSRKRADRLTYMLFLAPALLSFLLVIAVPFFMGLFSDQLDRYYAERI